MAFKADGEEANYNHILPAYTAENMVIKAYPEKKLIKFAGLVALKPARVIGAKALGYCGISVATNACSYFELTRLLHVLCYNVARW